MTRDCEYLAAWVDTEPCICGEPIGAPMEVSAAKLALAERLVRKVREIDRALEHIGKHNISACRTVIDYDSKYHPAVEFSVPSDIAQGLLRTLRFQTLVLLSQTGVTSMASGYRPVVSA